MKNQIEKTNFDIGSKGVPYTVAYGEKVVNKVLHQINIPYS